MTSRIPGFHKLPMTDRALRVQEAVGLTDDDRATLERGLELATADRLVENVVGTYALPLGIATNLQVDGRDVLVPMVVEESSVVAAASHGAKLARPHGGFTTEATDPVMVGQVQILDVEDPQEAVRQVEAAAEDLREHVDAAAGSLPERGGGYRGVEARVVDSPRGPMVVVHVLLDVRDAMGANAVNTVAEAVAPHLEAITGGRAHLRILSNLADHRVVTARAVFDREALGGEDVVEGILDAWAMAAADPYRAATHNKGIMNGVDAVVVATGNDWRAVEAGAHAYAARTGRYESLTRFESTPEGHLAGELTLPLALGTVGGTTRVHPQARVNLRILGVDGATDLARVAASVGLAQNLSALRALADEGIQSGHMRLHARNLAAQAGVPEAHVDAVAERMVEAGRVGARHAEAIWREIQDA